MFTGEGDTGETGLRQGESAQEMAADVTIRQCIRNTGSNALVHLNSLRTAPFFLLRAGQRGFDTSVTHSREVTDAIGFCRSTLAYALNTRVRDIIDECLKTYERVSDI